MGISKKNYHNFRIQNLGYKIRKNLGSQLGKI